MINLALRVAINLKLELFLSSFWHRCQAVGAFQYRGLLEHLRLCL